MVRTRWTEARNHYESLAVSLRTVLAAHGDERPYDELVAVLGLGALAVAVCDDALGWWCTYARDASLVQTARLYGLEVRALHPPTATTGLGNSPEYAQHFRDSYMPLIARALAHDQLVLAWRGWPEPREHLWGIITDADRGQLVGHTLWHDGRPLALAGPAHQVYLVEQFRPPGPGALTEAELFNHVARQACAAWAGSWAAGTNVKTGAAAYRAWQTALREPAYNATSPLPLYQHQSQATRVHVAARARLATWLRRVGGTLGAGQIELAAHWANACDRVGDRLLPYESPEVVRELLDQPDGAKRICRAISDVCGIEAVVVAALKERI